MRYRVFSIETGESHTFSGENPIRIIEDRIQVARMEDNPARAMYLQDCKEMLENLGSVTFDGIRIQIL